MRYKITQAVLREIGGLLIILAAVMILPFLVGVIYQEWYSAFGFLISGIAVGGLGYSLYKIFFKSTAEPELKHAMIIAALGWLIIALIGSIPFFIIAHITPTEVMQGFVPVGESYSSSLVNFKNPLHAFFESMSGFTTTGLTMSVHEPSVGKAVLFYRSLSQWIGGAGFIVMTLAILQDRPGPGLLSLYSSESSGIKLKPTVIGTARAIWKLYLGLTIFQIIYLIIGTRIILPDYPLTETIFDAINHAFAGQSTGGFSTLDNSISTYNSVDIDILYILPMVLGSLSLPFYFQIIYKKQFAAFWKDIQVRTLIPYYLVGGLILSFFLTKTSSISSPFREGIFQFISALSTTGWQTSVISNWDAVPILFVATSAMFIGGSVGSTVGGIKIKRALLIQKGLRWQVGKIFFPNKMIKTVKFDHKIMLPRKMNQELAEASTLAFIYLIIIIFSTMITVYFTGSEFTLKDAFFESASALGTVGLSTGVTGPWMPPVVEVSFILQMWAGRLEVIPILILLRAMILGTDPKII